MPSETPRKDDPAVRELLARALELPPEQRPAFLDGACDGNGQMRGELESLLAALRRSGDHLSEPTVDVPFASEAPTTGLREGPGSHIGRYKLLEPIGEGGFGVVFMAEQESPVRRMVALKVIKPGMDTSQVIARFEAERQALAMMDHPNISKVFEAGTTGAGRPYFVMELIRGSPITHYSDKHRLSTEARLRLFVQVCQAVQHAHGKGIIHRDLKPTNVLVTIADDGRPVPKVIDFGIAKATAAGQRLTDRTLFTEFRQLVGTPQYMSPEQAESDAMAAADTRSDVYALGVLLYELLTGTTPFEKERLVKATYDEVRRILREEEPPQPSTRLSTLAGEALTSVASSRDTTARNLGQLVRGELDWIVMRSLEKDRNRRYETAVGLANDVERYLRGEPVEACPPSRTYRLRKFARRNKTWITATAGVVLVLVATTLTSVGQAVRATRAEARADRERDWAVGAERRAVRERDRAIAEKRRADEETHIARCVNDFFGLVLGQADPSQHAAADVRPHGDLTVREALDRAAERLAGRYTGGTTGEVKLLESMVRQTLGMTYAGLSEYPKAEQQLEIALALAREAGGPEHSVTLYAMMNLGCVYDSQSKFAEAEPLLSHALAGMRSGDEAGSVTRVAETNLSMHYLQQHRYAEAEPLLLHAIGSAKPSPSQISALVVLYEGQRQPAKAEALLLQALADQRQAFGEQDIRTLNTKHNVAGLYMEQKKFEQAEVLYREVLAARRRILGDKHRDTLLSVEVLAEAYDDSGRTELAEPLFRQALEGRTAVLGARNPDTLMTLRHLGLTEEALGRREQAEQYFRQELELRRSALTGKEPDAALSESLSNLGRVECTGHRYSEAEKHLTEAVGLWRSQGNDGQLQAALLDLARVFRSQKNYAAAEPVLRELVSVRTRMYPPGNELTASAKSLLATVLTELAHYQEAESLLLAATADLTAWTPSRTRAARARETCQRLIALYEAWNKPELAARWRAKLPQIQPASAPTSQQGN